ncbi:MAG: hypothetical protein FJX15_14380 [Alphaproteobacteria bacterium]|nr:hypothetical protein [Alphaproteobacteria bacterium]
MGARDIPISFPRAIAPFWKGVGSARAKKLGEVGARGGGTDSAPRIGTPPAFRDLLISIARAARSDATGRP